MRYTAPKFILQSFGLQNLKTELYRASIVRNGDLKSSVNEYPEQNYIEVEKIADSYLGTPVFDNLLLDNLRIDTVLLDISQSKNIVKTAIQGLNGTVKEYIADGDYQIKIRGIIVSEDDSYPQADVNTLIEICKRPESIPVTANFFNLFGIDEIVIEDYSFPQEEGFLNMQRFEISAISDKPLELVLSSNL